jgi:hypothetical protein
MVLQKLDIISIFLMLIYSLYKNINPAVQQHVHGLLTEAQTHQLIVWSTIGALLDILPSAHHKGPPASMHLAFSLS